MNERMKERAGMVVAAVLAVDGLLHAYWATGAIWPARDERSLSMAVLGADVPFSLAVVGALACLLFAGALLMLARVHRLGRLERLIPDALLQTGALLVAAGLLLRGLAGIGWVLTDERGTTFYRLNLVLYTPLCLLLAAAALVAARSDRSPMPMPAVGD